MKANELMIGDWVYSSFYYNSTKPCRITGIRTFDIKDVYAFVYVDKVEDIKDINSLTPIPLTPEILEKNGFEKALQLSDTEPFDTDEEGNKHYSYNKTFWGWWQPDNIFCIPANGLGWLNIKYVHQLQHALRLCGIEKEIIL